MVRGECFIPEKAPNNWGYVRVNAGGRRIYLYRYLYEQEVGPIPDDCRPDHLCNNRACVNWDHIELVSHGENIRRGFERRGYQGVCKRGHVQTPENIIVRQRGSRVQRQCRACENLAKRRYFQRLKERRRALED